jgi:uncharacterized peroxidase-related enzyme
MITIRARPRQEYRLPHIPLPTDAPGIAGLLAVKPATGAKVSMLMQQLLRGDSPLSPAERELIAAHVSRLNECEFCARSHAATLRQLDGDGTLHRLVDARSAVDVVPPRLSALLNLAGRVTAGGRHVSAADIAAARDAGATDEEIHDTVLIAAAFCMINRYVDGLDANTPHDQASYDQMGAMLAAQGYERTAPPGSVPPPP